MYIITSKPGMTPFATAANRREANKLSRQAKSQGLDGYIVRAEPVVSGPPISDQLRAAVRSSGLSQAELSRRSDVPQQRISALLAGKGATTTTIDRLCRSLQLNLK